MQGAISNLDRVFEECLEALEDERWTLEDCLERYPTFRRDLEPLLRTALRLREGRSLRAPQTFRRQAVGRLQARLRASRRPPVSQGRLRSEGAAAARRGRTGLGRPRSSLRWATLILLAIFALSGLGGGVVLVADAAAPGIILGQAIGRLGCLVTGDALGKETGLPWGVSYLNPGAMAPDRAISYQPVFAYEALWDLAVFGVLWMLRKRIKRPGALFATYLALYAAGKFAITFLREERRWLWSLQEAHFVALSLAVISAGLWMWVYAHRLARDHVTALRTLNP